MNNTKTITLSKDDAMNKDNWKAGDSLVIDHARLPFTPHGISGSRPQAGELAYEWMDCYSVVGLIRSGLAHIERTVEVNPFDAPEFKGWESTDRESRIFTHDQKQIKLYSHGGIEWSDSPWHYGKPLRVNPTLAANLPAVARIINALAPITPAEVVAGAVVEFVKYKEENP